MNNFTSKLKSNKLNLNSSLASICKMYWDSMYSSATLIQIIEISKFNVIFWLDFIIRLCGRMCVCVCVCWLRAFSGSVSRHNLCHFVVEQSKWHRLQVICIELRWTSNRGKHSHSIGFVRFCAFVSNELFGWMPAALHKCTLFESFTTVEKRKGHFCNGSQSAKKKLSRSPNTREMSWCQQMGDFKIEMPHTI